jgi:hypothetical protein
MATLSSPEDIWTASPTAEDFAEGVRYASISLPWTFNRMMMRSTPNGQHKRAFNIAKGIVGQEVLIRLLQSKDISVTLPRDSHRDDDLFDIQIDIHDETKDADLKSMNYFNDYGDDRPPFSVDYVLENRDYDGPRWERFFPMMIPHTQMNQNKEVYIFAIAESIDFRNELTEGRSEHEFFSFPHGKMCEFLQKKQLIEAREQSDDGIYLSIHYDTMSYFESSLPEIEVIGEGDGKLKHERLQLQKNETIADIGPFSAVNSVWMPTEDFQTNFSGSLRWKVSRNELDDPVRNTSRRDLNQLPSEKEDVDSDWPMVIQKEDFCNLRLPDDYTLYFIGWLLKEEFINNCRNYRSYVWPDDDVDPDKNQPWSQLTERDRKMLKRIDFEDTIQSGAHRIDAGILKGMPQAGSAATYIYPNQHSGGLKETNTYILPKDLRTMDDLGRVTSNT